MDAASLFSDGNIVLAIVESGSYNEKCVQAASALSGKAVCYVTLSKTHDALRESFTKGGVDTKNFVFIDAISQTIRKAPSQEDGCYFASSPGALTEISMLVSKCLRHKFEYLVFDSISGLAIYQRNAPVARFISNIINQSRENNAKALFYVADSAQGQELAKECGVMVDKVVKL